MYGGTDFYIMCLKGLASFSQIVSNRPLTGEEGVGESVCSLNCSEEQSRTLTVLCSHHEVEKKIVFYDSQGESSAFMSTENPFL